MIKATPFDFPYDGQLVPQNTALLVIDLQEDLLSPSGYFARKGYDPAPLRAILPTVNRLIAAARSAGLTIAPATSIAAFTISALGVFALRDGRRRRS